MHQFQQIIKRIEAVPDTASPLLAGESATAQSMRQLVGLAAGTIDAVLLSGPAGAGKLALAKAVHAASIYKTASFIEATGSSFDKDFLTARWEGSLYLRGIMLLSVPLQHRLLTWLDSEAALHVRLIATSDGRDDSDRVIAPLRARLDRLRIPCPAMTHRRSDIAIIIQRLWDAEGDWLPPVLDHSGWAVLHDHNWPKNYRELTEFAAKSARLFGGKHMAATQVKHLLEGQTNAQLTECDFDLKQHLAEEEKRFLVEALLRCNGVVAAAAARSGLKRTTFIAKMKRYGLVRI